jgi:hypothetical protein
MQVKSSEHAMVEAFDDVPMNQVLMLDDAEVIHTVLWEQEGFTRYNIWRDRDGDAFHYDDGLWFLIRACWRPGITKRRWIMAVIKELKTGIDLRKVAYFKYE